MLKTVWLSNIIENDLAIKNSPLSVASNDLIEIFGSDGLTFFLYEPNGAFSLSCFVDLKEAYILEATNNEYRDRIFNHFQTSEVPLIDNSDLCLPLKTERTKAFGFVVLHGLGQSNAEALSNIELVTLNNFSSILHSEAVGSVARSYFKTVIDIKDLLVEYKTGQNVTVAVNNLNLELCENEFSLILGASGCGKTSLLNVVGGMLRPKSGQVIYNNEDITKYKGAKATNYRKDTVGFIFQQYNLISDLTAKENIEVASSLVKDSFSAEEVLEMVGLSKKINNYPGQMSGGEQQRVCIARALVKKPKLLLCDEPTGALDTKNAVQVLQILQDLVKKENVPVVMITHNSEFAAVADHYVMMSNGKVIEEYRQPFAMDAKNLVIR